MSTEKQNFAQQLRKETNYRYSRVVVQRIYNFLVFICVLCMIFSTLAVIVCFFSFFSDTPQPGTFLIAFSVLVCAVIVSFLNRLIYEWACLLFDIGDASIHSAYVNHANYVLASKRSKDA